MDISADVISPTGFRFSNEDLYEMKPTEENEEADQVSEAKETASSDTPTLSVELVHGFFNVYDRVRGKKTLSERLQKQKEIEEEIAAQNKKNNIAQDAPKKEEQPRPPSLPEKTVKKEIFAPKQDEHLKIPQEIESFYEKMSAFFSIVLRVLQSSNVSLDIHARFGVELFLAGACEHLCRRNNLTTKHHQLILSNILHQLGRSFSAAEKFYYNLDEYTLDAQNLSMFISGTNGMRIYYANNSSPELISLFLKSFNKWLRPEKKTPSAEKRTVMFTDMVSSTHVTQMLGDRMAQQLVRSHNTIVRKALQICGGIEIKHTGDGIMASFPWASNAVDAAVAIQQAVAEHNRQSPTVPLKIRIGLNSGELIVENNDLFGHTVQLASRVCSQADANQIYVSAVVVKELSAQKNYTFKPLGDFSLKGIDEPQQLYEVVWNSSENMKDNASAIVKKDEKKENEKTKKERLFFKSLPQF
ncbi:MAG: adenylate/guanylate cyclase domain-containing protein [Alphaproteobacteria bacterium]|nr:adenylate/guanylate cyclase domain-containing protein [Alphaproteobacteria bacterium]